MFIFLFICILLSACSNEIQENSSNVEETLKGKDVVEIEGNEWEIAEDNPKIVDGKVLLQWSSDYKDNKAYSYEVLFSADGEFGDLSSFKTNTNLGHLRCGAEENGVCPGIVYIKVDSQQIMQFEHDFESTITEMIENSDSSASYDVLKINYLQDSRYKILACVAGQCNESNSFRLDNTVDVTFYPMHLKFDGLHTFNEELFIEYKVQNSEGVLVSLNEYNDETTATLNDKTWLLPFISTEGVLTIQACLDSNDDNCQDYVIFDTKASTKRYITAFDDGSVLADDKNSANPYGKYTGSKLLAVYDRHKQTISFLAADQDCSKGVNADCPTVNNLEKRNERYLHWSVLNAINESEEVYSLAIAKSKLFVGLANLNKVKVYDISVSQYSDSGVSSVSLGDQTEIIAPDDFSQFGFSLAVVNDSKHLVVGSPADNRIAIYNTLTTSLAQVALDGGLGFSLAATDDGFLVGAPFSNQIIPYTVNSDVTGSEFTKETSIMPTAATTETAYYGYSIASIYITDPEQEDILNQDGTKSSFTDRIAQQHPSILTVCGPDGDYMECKVKVKDAGIESEAGYADFITASSMKGEDIFVVDTQDKLYISHDLTAASYFVETEVLKYINNSGAIKIYNGAPIAFESIYGTGEDGNTYNYSNILFGFENQPIAEVSRNLYTSSYKEYNDSLYKDHLFAFNAQGNYLDSTYYGYNGTSVKQSNHYIHDNKLYVSATDSYTNSQFVWDDNADNFLFCKDADGKTDCQTSKSADYSYLYVAKSEASQYFLYNDELYKAPSSDNKEVALNWDDNADNFFWCKDAGTSIRDCQTSKSAYYSDLYVAPGGMLSEHEYFLHVNGSATQTYKVTGGSTLANVYYGYIICYDGVTALYTQGEQAIYECQLSLPTNINLATNTEWPKYEVYSNHTLYKDGAKVSINDMLWCGVTASTFECETESKEGYMQFTDGKQTEGGLQKISNRAMVNGRWYNGEKDKHSSYTGKGRDGDDEKWKNGYCIDGYHDKSWLSWNNQCALVDRRFNEK